MVANNKTNTKRIAKNTAYLYLRMLFTTILALYTARVVLKVLGVEDFGIYNVVGGVVTFMGFLTATMSSATQRYLTFHLGKGDSERFKQTFSLLINIHLIFCGIAFIILEIAGPLYISKFMTIPPNRVVAAQWVFQFSLITFLLNTISVPYRSSIVAYEKMDFYAYIGVAEAVFNLVVAISLSFISSDSLVFYAFLMCLVQILIVAVMVLYCRSKLDNCRYIKYWDRAYVKELISYSGWNLFGSTTGVLNLQGQALVLNYFFGPLVNAAKAVADKVNGMINQFSQNFYMAVTPQIIKSYAAGDVDYMRSLVLNSSRYSFLLLFIISVPLFVVMEPLLNLWLGCEQVSSEMVKFCQYTIIYSLVNVLEQPITMAVRATGDIKKYQIYVGTITLSFIPLCIILFLLGAPAYTSMILLSAVFFVALFVRIRIVAPIVNISTADYIKSVLLPLIFVLAVTLIIIELIVNLATISKEWVIYGIIALVVACVNSLFIGLRSNERNLLWNYTKNRIFNNSSRNS